MIRADYTVLAAALREARPVLLMSDVQGPLSTWRKTVATLCNHLERDNGRFRRDQFLIACGYKDED